MLCCLFPRKSHRRRRFGSPGSGGGRVGERWRVLLRLRCPQSGVRLQRYKDFLKRQRKRPVFFRQWRKLALGWYRVAHLPSPLNVPSLHYIITNWRIGEYDYPHVTDNRPERPTDYSPGRCPGLFAHCPLWALSDNACDTRAGKPALLLCGALSDNARDSRAGKPALLLCRLPLPTQNLVEPVIV